MSVCYLEVDDEITDAVARLRAARDGRVVVVLPPGSRIGTSRINFRLLAREAEGRGIAIALVSGEAGVRALASSAGMPSHGTVPEAEVALGLPVDGADGVGALREVDATAPAVPAQPRGGARTRDGIQAVDEGRAGVDRDGSGPAVPARIAEEALAVGGASGSQGAAGSRGAPGSKGAPGTEAMPPPTAVPRIAAAPSPARGVGLAGAETTAASTAPIGFAVTPRATTGALAQPGGYGDPMLADPRALEAAERARAKRQGRGRTRRLVGLFVRLAVIVAILSAAAYGAYLYLPTATIRLTPTTRPFGPLTVTVTADPSVAVPDPAAGLVPAERVPIPLSATATFPASGTQVSLSKAIGTVRFTSQNTVTDVIVPDGTKVSSTSGVDFETTQPATLPRATVSGSTITPSAANTPIRALKAGPVGNVGAGTITVEPAILNTEQVQATNPQPTTGGKKTQSPVVTRADYDGAVQSLTTQLQSQLAAALNNPATTPRGLSLFPATADLGKVTTDKAASDVVGSASDSFDLTADSQSSALAVDQTQVATVAAKQLTDSAPSGIRVFADTVKTEISEGSVNGTRIAFAVTATAQQYDPIDPGAVTTQIHGKTVSEARSILAAYGSVEVSVWPDFIPTIPDDARRINLTIEDPQVSQ